MKKNIIYILITIAFTILICEAKCQTYYGANMVNFETYTDSISEGWLLDCYSAGDTMSFRLRSEPDKGFKSVQPYIDFKNRAAQRGITVKFMYCADATASAQVNFDRIKSLKDAGCYVPDIELFNEFYANDPEGTKGTCEFDFNCYKLLFEPIVNKIKASYPDTKFFFCLANNRGRNDQIRWNNAVKDYIQNNPLYHVTYHLYYNANDCDSLSVAITPQLITSSYNPYLDNHYLVLRTQLYAATYLQDVQNWLASDFPNKLVAYTEIGIVGGDPEKGNTAEIRNTFVYAEFIWYLLQNIQAYEVDIHSGIALTGIIQPTSKNDVQDGVKNKKRMEYFSLFLNRKLTAKAGVCYLPLFDEPFLAGYNATVIGYEYVSTPFYYSSLGATNFFKNGSLKSYVIPLKTDPFIFGHVFGYKIVNFTPACRDTSYFVNDTTYTTIQVANPISPKCSRFFYSLFHGKECTATYRNEQQMIITRKEINETICN